MYVVGGVVCMYVCGRWCGMYVMSCGRWCGMYACHVVGGVVCMYVMW